MWTKGGKPNGSRCRTCQLEAARSWRRKGKIRSDRYDIARMDEHPVRCMSQMFGTHPCRKKARWRNGEWRACDEHKLPGDAPISGAP